jgi:hypothetical protein
MKPLIYKGFNLSVYKSLQRVPGKHVSRRATNYARFLDYCTERLFLQRVGGRYRFIHKMLQDHFAHFSNLMS